MNLNYENQKIQEGYSYVIGCDEVGRGCLAGPVVAAAVVFSPDANLEIFKDVNDSKKLTVKKREKLSEVIKEKFLWSIAEVSPEAIDEINIHQASLLAMKRAVKKLGVSVIPEILPVHRSLGEGRKTSEKLSGIQDPGKTGSRLGGRDDAYLFIDGKFKIPDFEIKQEPVIAGDAKVFSIAAASIIAKVYRDNLMQEFNKQYPVYEFAKHKGYATEVHRKSILKNGLSPIHRVSFCGNFIK